MSLEYDRIYCLYKCFICCASPCIFLHHRIDIYGNIIYRLIINDLYTFKIYSKENKLCIVMNSSQRLLDCDPM